MPRRPTPLLALVAEASLPAAPAALSAAAARHALGAAFASAALAGGANAFLALFTEVAVFLRLHGAAVQDRAAFEPWMTAAAGMFTFTGHAMRFTRIEEAGDVARVSGTLTETFQIADGLTATGNTGKVAFLADRQADDPWRLAAEIWNSDLPLPLPGH